MKRERRYLQSEVTVEQGETPKITGYAVVFNSRSHLLGDFVEEVDPGAFTECLAGNPQILGLYNHNDSMVLGTTTAGTMRVSVDANGLKYEIDPPDTSYARDLLVSMKRGDIQNSSFGFVCHKDAWSYDKVSKHNVRRILKADLFDCSPVVAPAYGDSSAQLRSLFPDDKGSIPEEITSKIAELRTACRKEKRGRSILSAVSSSKWAILPEKLETICAFLANWSDGQVASKEQIQAALMGYDNYDDYDDNNVVAEDGIVTKSPVAVISMYGTIGQKMTMMTDFSGGCSCESLTKQFRAALADDSIKSIVFDIDSPGGTVTGVPELAAEILASRGKKPIVAVSNGMAASAAIWLATAADEVVCIPSGQVGSIGVYCTHQDVSAAMEKAGVSITFIKAGKYKTEGNPYEHASDEYFAYQQKGVDATYADFLQAVADGRGVSVEKVESDFGQGRMLSSKDALAAGLIDRIATLDEVIAGLTVDALVTEQVGEFTNPTEQASVTASIGAESEPIIPATCQCVCPGCMGGNCAECDADDCDWEDGDDEGCDCGVEDDEDGDGDEMDLTKQTPEIAAEVVAEINHTEAEANLNAITKAKVMRMFS